MRAGPAADPVGGERFFRPALLQNKMGGQLGGPFAYRQTMLFGAPFQCYHAIVDTMRRAWGVGASGSGPKKVSKQREGMEASLGDVPSAACPRVSTALSVSVSIEGVRGPVRPAKMWSSCSGASLERLVKPATCSLDAPDAQADTPSRRGGPKKF